MIWRYFVTPLPTKLAASQLDEREFVLPLCHPHQSHAERRVHLLLRQEHGRIQGQRLPRGRRRVLYAGKLRGLLLDLPRPLSDQHPGWWGGAHPFALLDTTVVHNGEISSYDANRRFIEMFGYSCDLLTDTEVITYIIDYLGRKLGLTYSEIANVIAAPFWSTIEKQEPKERERLTYLRNAFASLMVTGPFSILVGYTGGLMALNDRPQAAQHGRRRKGRHRISSPPRNARSASSSLSWISWAPRAAASRSSLI